MVGKLADKSQNLRGKLLGLELCRHKVNQLADVRFLDGQPELVAARNDLGKHGRHARGDFGLADGWQRQNFSDVGEDSVLEAVIPCGECPQQVEALADSLNAKLVALVHLDMKD